jgi:hypothetical protein
MSKNADKEKKKMRAEMAEKEAEWAQKQAALQDRLEGQYRDTVGFMQRKEVFNMAASHMGTAVATSQNAPAAPESPGNMHVDVLQRHLTTLLSPQSPALALTGKREREKDRNR